MDVTVGIRREDKNDWERRAPLAPNAVAALKEELGCRFLVQPSPIRSYADHEYEAAGAELSESLQDADIVLAIKEIPIARLRLGKTYIFFSHVIKGQPQNMPMLSRILELGCTLLDYEKITDERGRRLIAFGVHAGYAGMIQILWCLGQRLKEQGIPTPLADVRHAYQYDDLRAAKRHLRGIGERIRQEGLEGLDRPLVVGIAGYGNVAQGCQEILRCLPVTEVKVEELPTASTKLGAGVPRLLQVVFKEEHMVEPLSPAAAFELQDYYEHPEKYVGCFERHLPHMDVLINGAYWDERYPRVLTKEWAMANRNPRLQVLGDISCDIGGGVELTRESTDPGDPCYSYDREADALRRGFDGEAPVIMAVDNLPCELPRDSSRHFSEILRDMIPGLAHADWGEAIEDLDLPRHMKKAVIAHHGELTPDFLYLQPFLRAARKG